MSAGASQSAGRCGLGERRRRREASHASTRCTNEVTKRIRVGNGATALAYGARSLWVANGFDGTISRIEPKTSAVINVPTGGTPR